MSNDRDDNNEIDMVRTLYLKSKEIKRLHGVCQSKDKTIETLTEHLKYILGIVAPDDNIITPQYRKQLAEIITDSENSIG